MSSVTSGTARPRKGRGRPRPRNAAGSRNSAPTRSRLLALRVLERVERAGAFADVLLHAQLGRSPLGARDRAFATELVYGTLRWRGRIDYLLSHVLDQNLEKLEPLVATALRLGVYQLLFSDSVPANAAVDESVRCIRAAGSERATGLVNAVLRRLASESASIALPSLDRDPLGHLAHALSLPTWLAARWLELYGPAEAAALARASNTAPPLTVRTNRLRTSPEALLADLRVRFPEAQPCRFAPDGIVLGRRGNPALDPSFLVGGFTVQDEGAQLVVELLDPRPGERVLDTCAAPGGKATAIGERVGPQGAVVALDRNNRRLDLARRSVRRLGLGTVDCIEQDATRDLTTMAARTPFDRVLVDAPCSGLGTLRRNADARWRVAAGDPARLAVVQRSLLDRAAAVLRPGAVLVYSTCTLLPEENEEIVEGFLSDATDFALTPADDVPASVRGLVGADGFLRCLPHVHDTDGFFAARFERRK